MYGTRSLGASFGAEVLGFQLSGTPSDADISAIRELWAEHKLLLFRNQSFDEATLVGFSRQFGDLETIGLAKLLEAEGYAFTPPSGYA